MVILQITSLEECHVFPFSPSPTPFVLWTNHVSFCIFLSITSLVNEMAIYSFTLSSRPQIRSPVLPFPIPGWHIGLFCIFSHHFQVSEKWLFLGIKKKNRSNLNINFHVYPIQALLSQLGFEFSNEKVIAICSFVLLVSLLYSLLCCF